MLALLFGQFSGASSLREIEAGLTSHSTGLYHLGAKRAARSTLSDANAKRPWALFADLFAHMVTTANRSTRRSLGDATRIIDATKVKLSGLSGHWARFSANHCAAKLHIVHDPDEAMPLKADVTPDNVNDITGKDLVVVVASPLGLASDYLDDWTASVSMNATKATATMLRNKISPVSTMKPSCCRKVHSSDKRRSL